MPQLSHSQAQELIKLITDLELANFFEKLHEYGIHSPEVTHFEKEFMSGRYSFDFYERLTAFVNANAATKFVLENPKFDIFFSFSKHNQEEAESAVGTLRRAGLNVFFSNDTLQDVAGSSFLPKINHALKNSQHFVLLCTPKSIQADWVVYEYETFFKEAYIKSRQQRKLFILEGEGFSHGLLDDTLSSIQTSRKVANILMALGKEVPNENDLKEKKQVEKRRLEQKQPLDTRQNQPQSIATEQSINTSKSGLYTKLLGSAGIIVVAFLGFNYLQNQSKEKLQHQQQATEEKLTQDKKQSTETVQGTPKQGFVYETVAVEGGTFEMGYVPKRDGQDNLFGNSAKPSFTATVSNFEIGKYEVTQAQWEMILSDNDTGTPRNIICENCPMVVYWKNIQEFIDELNRQYPPANGGKYRLPTEEEWEFAARGGKQSKGFVFSGSNEIEAVAWYNRNSDNKAHEVGTKQPNELGIYDMSGNATEWTSSYWTNGHKASKDNSRYVLRGGAYNKMDKACTNYARSNDSPNSQFAKYGFRLVIAK